MDVLIWVNLDEGKDLLVDVQITDLDNKSQVWTDMENLMVSHKNKNKANYLYLWLD